MVGGGWHAKQETGLIDWVLKEGKSCSFEKFLREEGVSFIRERGFCILY
jgi:hypothetical protein